MSTASLDHTASPASARRRGLAGAATLMPAIAPLGIALGVALGAMSAPATITWLSAPMMVAGASQLVLFSQLESGSGFLVAAAAAIMLNSRFVIYGAALSQRFGPDQPAWFRTLGPHFIVDQTYAMTLTGVADDDTADEFRCYFTTAGTALWAIWTVSVGIGILSGPILPSQLPLDFVLPASFIALIVPGLTTRTEAIAVITAAVWAIPGLDSTTTLAAAATTGAVIGWSTTKDPR